MADETKQTVITEIQDANGNRVRIRVGDVEVPVLHGGPVPGKMCTNYTLTIENVRVEYERDAPAA
ncbi:hypothetical protein [Methylobacterium brachythecii]|uniref:Uncharacterized protein n=1 Tax=Methylobacterium brachythecii TaxID=1176177 RepID=A0A7W6AMX2_9HYPH|nr:hypothetical protein [Methylobacterium brachythecii]MBB3904169.1 hypothetical protein [Methylobacterium brachythecii]GLS45169.1 hypothetical protein GCM10007884_31580 [Methylobacterium brachythecii]